MTNKSIKIIFLFFLILPGVCFSEQYFVSKDNGSDKNNGLSWNSSWKTLIYAGKKAQAGDIVYIRKSKLPYRYLKIMNKGIEKLPIIFRGENLDDPPVLSGSVRLLEWESTQDPFVWRHPLVYRNARFLKKTPMLLENEEPLVNASGTKLLAGEWRVGSEYIYYSPTHGKPIDYHLRALGYSAGVIAHDIGWVVIDNITCDMSPGACVSIKNGNNIVIRKITSEWSWRGVDMRENSYNNLVENSKFYFNQEAIYIRNKSSYNIVNNCIAMNNGRLPTWRYGDRHAVAIGEKGPNIGNRISNSEIAYNGAPPDNVALITFRGPDTIFDNNNVHHNFGSGLFVTTESHGSFIINNIVHKNGEEAIVQGIKGIAGLSIRNSKNIRVINNKITDNYVSNDSIYKNYYVGKHGGLDIEGVPRKDMMGIILKNNVVRGTIGGPNLNISSRPVVGDIKIINTP